MWNPSKHLSVATRLKGLVALSVLAVLGVAISLLVTMLNQQMHDRRQAVRQTVEVAHSLVSHYGQLAAQGRLTPTEAQRQAMAALNGLRYDQREYFWVNDLDGQMIHPPIKPQLNGTFVGDMKDPNGVKLFQEFNGTVRQHGQGFVNYQWPKPGEDAPVDKVSYVKGYQPWNWVIGSGLYVDDIHKAFAREALQVMVGTGLCALLLGGLALRTARRLTRGVDAAVQVAEAIAEGDIREHHMPREWSHGHDELSRLLKAMQAMSKRLKDTVSTVQQTVDSVAPVSYTHLTLPTSDLV